LDISISEQVPSSAAHFEPLKQAIAQSVTSKDLFRLSKQLADLQQRASRKQDIAQGWSQWRQAAERSQQIVSARRDNLPAISYPDLPVSARSDEIVELIRNHQVLVVAGETGSGKTTQLPKICYRPGAVSKALLAIPSRDELQPAPWPTALPKSLKHPWERPWVIRCVFLTRVRPKLPSS